jgi:hypothetical protein
LAIATCEPHRDAAELKFVGQLAKMALPPLPLQMAQVLMLLFLGVLGLALTAVRKK